MVEFINFSPHIDYVVNNNNLTFFTKNPFNPFLLNCPLFSRNYSVALFFSLFTILHLSFLFTSRAAIFSLATPRTYPSFLIFLFTIVVQHCWSQFSLITTLLCGRSIVYSMSVRLSVLQCVCPSVIASPEHFFFPLWPNLALTSPTCPKCLLVKDLRWPWTMF